MADRPAVNIFVSYRRRDTGHLAGRLYDRLVDRFDRNQVFMDVDTIEPGTDYHEVIDRAVGASDVVLALIGPTWLTGADDRGRRRLDDPDDLVRSEIRAALGRDVRLIPVVVDGTPMPDAEELPAELRPLRRRQAVALDHPTFRSDVEALVSAIARVSSTPGVPGVPPPAVEPPPPTTRLPLVTADRPQRWWRDRAVLALGVIGLLTAAALIGWSLRSSKATAPSMSGPTVAETVPTTPTTSATPTIAPATPAPHASAVPVPDVAGQSADDAEHVLRQAGFRVVRRNVDAGGDQGDVVGTDPPAGTQAAGGSTVTLLVSTGDSSAAEVPDVTGKRLDQAVAALNQAGFTRVQGSPSGATPSFDNRVTAQSPSAGTRASVDDLITLTVA